MLLTLKTCNYDHVNKTFLDMFGYLKWQSQAISHCIYAEMNV